MLLALIVVLFMDTVTQKLEEKDFEAFAYHDVNIEEKYDDLAKIYDDVLHTVGWPDPEQTALLVIDNGFTSESKVLDMGCGTGLVGGHLAHKLNTTELNIDGIDAS